jgi:hypothetical protein
MGLALPPDYEPARKLAVTVSRLEARHQSLLQDLSDYALDAGLTRVVKAVVASEEWAIAVWPAVEGHVFPRSDGTDLDMRFHVADRIDFRRIDGEAISKDDVWDAFEDVLKASRSVPSLPRDQRWITADEGNMKRRTSVTSSWSIRRLAVPHASTIDMAHPGLASVAVTALTVGAWGNDVADHLSRLLGYGLTTTRDVATDLYGGRSDQEYGEDRASIHDLLLESSLPKDVWGHFSATTSGVASLLGRPDIASTFTVFLDQPESDLEMEADRLQHRNKERRRTGRETTEPFSRASVLDRLRRVQNDVRWMAKERAGAPNLLVVPLSARPGASTREAKFIECLDVVSAVVRHWLEAGTLTEAQLSAYWRTVEERLSRHRSDGDRQTLKLVEYLRYKGVISSEFTG